MPRSFISLLIPLLACSTPDADQANLPVDQAAPATTHAMAIVRGERNLIFVEGLAPHQRGVTLLASTATSGNAWCPPQLSGMCTDLLGNGVALYTVNADARGVATFAITPGVNFAPDLVTFQAITRAQGAWQLAAPVQVQVLDGAADSDGDGVPNRLEARLKSNPLATDTDGDLVDDGDEVTAGTSPTDEDSDDDGADDGEEVEDGTDPMDDDSDDDGLEDGEEDDHGTDPLDDDSDDDGLDDGPEVEHGLEPDDADCDDDGVDDGDELVDGSDPLDDDSDDDGIGDLDDTDDDVSDDTGSDDTGVEDTGADDPLDTDED